MDRGGPFSKPKCKNAGLTWSNMLTQESMDSIINTDFLGNAKVHYSRREEGLQKRGTEQYLTKLCGSGNRARALKRKRQEEVNDDGSGAEKCKLEDGSDAGDYKKTEKEGIGRKLAAAPREFTLDSEISDGGLSDDSLSYVKENFKKKMKSNRQSFDAAQKRMLNYRKKDEDERRKDEDSGKRDKEEDMDMDETGPSKRRKVETPIGSVNVDDTVSVDDKTTEKPGNDQGQGGAYSKSWKIQHLERMKDKDERFVVMYLIRHLQERKDYLIRNSMQFLGREVCIRIFLKTMKINYYGGLLVKKKYKTRTRGGIFLYLIKNDKRIEDSVKAKLNKANVREDEERNKIRQAKAQQAKYEAAPSVEDKMNLIKNAVMKKLNVNTETTSRNPFDLDLDNDDMTEEVRRPPVVVPDRTPARQQVDYGDIFDDSVLFKTMFDDAEF